MRLILWKSIIGGYLINALEIHVFHFFKHKHKYGDACPNCPKGEEGAQIILVFDI